MVLLVQLSRSPTVALCLLTLGGGDHHREEAGAVIIDIQVKVIAVEVVDERCPLLTDM